MKKISIFLLMMMVVLSAHTYAETIGVVDLQKVFVSYDETDKARKDFEKKQAELRKELDKKQKQLEKAQKDNKKPEEIEALIKDIQEELQPKQEELIQLNNELMASIRTDILKATKKVAKNYGVDIVFDKQAVLHGGFELTDFVIDELND